MKIPKTTRTPRFYVAISEKKALSSWNKLQESERSIKILTHYCPKDAEKVIGIIETGPDFASGVIHRIDKKLDTLTVP
jgi:hypothetical protein